MIKLWLPELLKQHFELADILLPNAEEQQAGYNNNLNLLLSFIYYILEDFSHFANIMRKV